jgi:hypothetical protein
MRKRLPKQKFVLKNYIIDCYKSKEDHFNLIFLFSMAKVVKHINYL